MTVVTRVSEAAAVQQKHLRNTSAPLHFDLRSFLLEATLKPYSSKHTYTHTHLKRDKELNYALTHPEMQTRTHARGDLRKSDGIVDDKRP